jgi:hypothetical protein
MTLSEMVFALILNLARRVHIADIEYAREISIGVTTIGIQLRGKTIGIVGRRYRKKSGSDSTGLYYECNRLYRSL